MFRTQLFRRGTILSGQGFRVTLKTRYNLEYVEGALYVNLNDDAAFPNLDVLILSLQSTYNGLSMELSAEQKERLLKKTEAALAWKSC